ncbi:MAG: glycosyltransferase family 4 protein, partial [Calditrichia bacterium]
QSYFFNAFKYKPGIRRAYKLNDVIATISEFSKKDISQKVGVPESKIQVIPNGMRPLYPSNPAMQAELGKRFGLDDGFVLNVGGVHERKNIVRLIHAFAILVKKHHFPGKLLITGSVSGAPYQAKMKALCDTAVREKEMGERVIFTGYVSDEELDSLMRMALFLIYPSLYEGFGIPVLEAMQVGTPVITSNVTAMPEVTGDAALLVDPLNEQEMTAAMAKLISDEELRNALIHKGNAQVKLFS